MLVAKGAKKLGTRPPKFGLVNHYYIVKKELSVAWES